MDLRELLAKNIRVERAAQRLSQEQLGELSGLTRNYIGSIERCEQAATVDTIEAIARGLSCSAAELLSARKKR